MTTGLMVANVVSIYQLTKTYMIKTTVGRTYNLGNYENIYIEIVQDGDSGADPQRLLKEAEQEVKKFFESYKNPKLETKGGLVETEFQRVLDEYVWEKGTKI